MAHVSAPSSSLLWHLRLGHLSSTKLKQISLLSLNNCNISPCDICHFSKQKRLPFYVNPAIATFAFELLHIDIWGPFKQHSYNGYKYFLTIVDDFTR